MDDKERIAHLEERLFILANELRLVTGEPVMVWMELSEKKRKLREQEQDTLCL